MIQASVFLNLNTGNTMTLKKGPKPIADKLKPKISADILARINAKVEQANKRIDSPDYYQEPTEVEENITSKNPEVPEIDEIPEIES